uniref:methyltransferase domain-containing protein n=1 Tax=Nonomuraea pusilla TaxID=46177 RepID=UPI0006E32B02|nr:methyltransferase domain-containing protein [Nonomuraea pusilla]
MQTLAVARAVHGIEPLVAAEIERHGLGAVRGLRHREVWFEPAGPPGRLASLRTADDVLLVAAVVDGVGRTRAALARLAAAASSLDARRFLRSAGVPGRGGLEVSASSVGRRTYGRYEIEDAVGAELARRLGLAYHSRSGGARPPAGALAWRVTLEGDRAVIALRAGARPLHRRAYKTASVPGTLHPPVAAAMARLAGLDAPGAPGRVVLDPCAGAGTVLIEAAARAPEARLLGFDRDPAAVRAATANAANAAPAAHPACAARLPCPALCGGPRFSLADAGRLPLARGSVDRVLVNPPWGRQAPPRGLLARDAGRLWREVRRVLAPDGLAVALVHGAADTGTEAPAGFLVVRAMRISLSGLHPELLVLAPG